MDSLITIILFIAMLLLFNRSISNWQKLYKQAADQRDIAIKEAQKAQELCEQLLQEKEAAILALKQ